MYKAFVITISDKGSQGLRQDTAGPALCEILKQMDFEVLGTKIISDDSQGICDALIDACDVLKADLVLTTGGTGFGPRDNTPEATKSVIEKECPGIPEAMRMESYKITPNGCLSRGVAGIRGNSLIVNCPGSEKAAKENFVAVALAVKHGLDMMNSVEH